MNCIEGRMQMETPEGFTTTYGRRWRRGVIEPREMRPDTRSDLIGAQGPTLTPEQRAEILNGRTLTAPQSVKRSSG